MDRIALVIGNSKYQNGNALANPGNDANDIESVLSKLSFERRQPRSTLFPSTTHVRSH